MLIIHYKTLFFSLPHRCHSRNVDNSIRFSAICCLLLLEFLFFSLKLLTFCWKCCIFIITKFVFIFVFDNFIYNCQEMNEYGKIL